MQTLDFARTTKLMLFVLLTFAIVLFAHPAFAVDAIPGAKEAADTTLATVRVVMIGLATVIVIVSVLLAMAHKISFTTLAVTCILSIFLGAAEPIVRFFVSLGQSA